MLLSNREYAFVVPGAMLDSNGRTLGKDVVKKFRTSAEEGVGIDSVVVSIRQSLKRE